MDQEKFTSLKQPSIANMPRDTVETLKQIQTSADNRPKQIVPTVDKPKILPRPQTTTDNKMTQGRLTSVDTRVSTGRATTQSSFHDSKNQQWQIQPTVSESKSFNQVWSSPCTSAENKPQGPMPPTPANKISTIQARINQIHMSDNKMPVSLSNQSMLTKNKSQGCALQGQRAIQNQQLIEGKILSNDRMNPTSPLDAQVFTNQIRTGQQFAATQDKSNPVRVVAPKADITVASKVNTIKQVDKIPQANRVIQNVKVLPESNEAKITPNYNVKSKVKPIISTNSPMIVENNTVRLVTNVVEGGATRTAQCKTAQMHPSVPGVEASSVQTKMICTAVTKMICYQRVPAQSDKSMILQGAKVATADMIQKTAASFDVSAELFSHGNPISSRIATSKRATTVLTSRAGLTITPVRPTTSIPTSAQNARDMIRMPGENTEEEEEEEEEEPIIPKAPLDNISSFKQPLNCRSIIIGSFKFPPKPLNSNLKVYLALDGISFNAPMVSDNTKILNIILKPCDVTQLLVHFGKCLPILFIFTTPTFAENIRKSLNMTSPDFSYYDPTSNDEKIKKITFLIDAINEEQQSFLRFTFLNDKKVKELDQKTANEMLVKSTPSQTSADNRPKQSVRTVDKPKILPRPQTATDNKMTQGRLTSVDTMVSTGRATTQSSFPDSKTPHIQPRQTQPTVSESKSFNQVWSSPCTSAESKPQRPMPPTPANKISTIQARINQIYMSHNKTPVSRSNQSMLTENKSDGRALQGQRAIQSQQLIDGKILSNDKMNPTSPPDAQVFNNQILTGQQFVATQDKSNRVRVVAPKADIRVASQVNTIKQVDKIPQANRVIQNIKVLPESNQAKIRPNYNVKSQVKPIISTNSPMIVENNTVRLVTNVVEGGATRTAQCKTAQMHPSVPGVEASTALQTKMKCTSVTKMKCTSVTKRICYQSVPAQSDKSMILQGAKFSTADMIQKFAASFACLTLSSDDEEEHMQMPFNNFEEATNQAQMFPQECEGSKFGQSSPVYQDEKSNWTEHKAPGRTYFYNHATKQTSWENPDELKSQPECPWIEYNSETGRTFYHNIQTKESCWTIPKQLEDLKNLVAAKEGTESY